MAEEQNVKTRLRCLSCRLGQTSLVEEAVPTLISSHLVMADKESLPQAVQHAPKSVLVEAGEWSSGISSQQPGGGEKR